MEESKRRVIFEYLKAENVHQMIAVLPEADLERWDSGEILYRIKLGEFIPASEAAEEDFYLDKEEFAACMACFYGCFQESFQVGGIEMEAWLAIDLIREGTL